MASSDWPGTDLYQVLELSESASSADVRRAYRRLVVFSHPDLNPRNRGPAERRMVEINIAATVLLDPDRRAAYDRARTRWHATQHQLSGPWDFWGTHSFSDFDDWASPVPTGGGPVDRELSHAVRGFRSRGGRAFHSLLELTLGLSASSHALVTALTLGAALLLISVAKPRSLGPLFRPNHPQAPSHGASASP